MDLLTLLCAVACGLSAGFFFAFSAGVMQALSKLPPAQGIAAMQSINVAVINPWFMTLFFGAPAACAFAIAASILLWQDPRAAWWLAGGLVYVVGTFLVTMFCNVPRNNALDAVTSTSADAARLWSVYLSEWTAWNHVRTVAALAAAVAFSIAA
ncbi:MAG: anthrone oxygenase family protein [Steroidobacteraceae bacterium]